MPDDIDVTQPAAVGGDISEPSENVLAEVRQYYSLLQADYTRRVAEVEKFLGFAEGTEALGTRLGKIEVFLGLKG